ncbi:phage holin family protein [Consotaella salsifontis]|uniref:Putative Holin-X, holin superfamily III n=1 Tax=Consotaella salsifontis TaxID=1365950 RepID=A0A1T4T8G5_9HYPH|nr:phage holin family protein [Consotaella salsifontis]SKA36717.1 Putative Holin-X, holin superfamily III [Consotaella salsifontis]
MAVDPQDTRPLDPQAARSIPDLISDLLRETTDLFRTEGQLIRAEIGDKIRQVEIAGGSLVAGAICLLVSLIVLAMALVTALAEFMHPGWAALIVGVVIAVVGVALLMKGRKDLEPSNLTPDRTAHQLRQDTRLAKEQVR